MNKCRLPEDIATEIQKAAAGGIAAPPVCHPYVALRENRAEATPENVALWRMQTEAWPAVLYGDGCGDCPTLRALGRMSATTISQS
ncbi:MAG TPA: hypothetical protein VFL85_05215 [Candidatus Saccharimonadales bacterium]|nr:hypothetical protein [Candidatus Saccharimonadales bacterium]